MDNLSVSRTVSRSSRSLIHCDGSYMSARFRTPHQATLSFLNPTSERSAIATRFTEPTDVDVTPDGQKRMSWAR